MRQGGIFRFRGWHVWPYVLPVLHTTQPDAVTVLALMRGLMRLSDRLDLYMVRPCGRLSPCSVRIWGEAILGLAHAQTLHLALDEREDNWRVSTIFTGIDRRRDLGEELTTRPLVYETLAYCGDTGFGLWAGSEGEARVHHALACGLYRDPLFAETQP
jgi:hypothetical protein